MTAAPAHRPVPAPRPAPAARRPGPARRRGRRPHARRNTAIGLVLTALMLFPVYWMVNVSLTPQQDMRKDPPDLLPLRKQLMDMVKRPVNLQASRDIVLSFRGELLDQPYLTLFTKPEGLSLSKPPVTKPTLPA